MHAEMLDYVIDRGERRNAFIALDGVRFEQVRGRQF